MINNLVIIMALVLVVNLSSFADERKSEPQTINVCVMDNFCKLNMRKCKDRCRLQMSNQLLDCIDNYDKVTKHSSNIDELKNKWELNCRIEKLKSLYGQTRTLNFGDDARATYQKNALKESLQNELDKRFESFYEMP